MAQNEATLLIRIKEAGAGALSKIQDGLGFIADKAKYVGAALAGFAAAGIAAYREAEQASNALNQSMVQQGVFTIELRDKYNEMGKAIQQNTTYSDDAVTAAQAVMQSHLGSIPITKELMQATVDLAAAKKIDLSTAAEMVSKAVGTETNALARQGIELDPLMSKTEKMAAVTEQLTQKFGGQAEAAAQGLGGLDQLKNALEDVMEVVGERLAPYVSFFVKQLKDFSIQVQENQDVLNGLDATIKFLSAGFIVLKNMILGTVEVISTGLAAAVTTVSLAAQGELDKAKEVAAMGMDEIAAITVNRKNQLYEELELLEQQKEITDQARRDRELLAEQTSSTNKIAVKQKEADQEKALQDKRAKEQKAQQDKMLAEEKKRQEELVANRRDTLSTISTLQNSNNKALAVAGKAAGITQIAIDTPVAISKAMAAFPPPFNFVAAGLVAAAMATQAARIAGVQLAEGGIVKATPGGVPAIIGEGGQDEAVIPLDRAGEFGLGGGGGATIIFNGPILGDEAQAMEFARAIDKNLLKLRQSGQSLAFETDVF